MEENKVKTTMSAELAAEEIRRWAKANDLEIFTTGANGKEIFDASVPKLIAAVEKGSLVVNCDGDLEYTVSQKSPDGVAGETITLKAPTGAAYMAMDSYGGEQGVHKTLAVAAAMSGKDVAWFGKLANSDYKIVVAIVSFFIVG